MFRKAVKFALDECGTAFLKEVVSRGDVAQIELMAETLDDTVRSSVPRRRLTLPKYPKLLARFTPVVVELSLLPRRFLLKIHCPLARRQRTSCPFRFLLIFVSVWITAWFGPTAIFRRASL